MKFRIIKSEVSGRTVYIPQHKPCWMVQLLQLDFSWRMFYQTTVKVADAHVLRFSDLNSAIKFFESGAYKDVFAKQVVWLNGKVVSDAPDN